MYEDAAGKDDLARRDVNKCPGYYFFRNEKSLCEHHIYSRPSKAEMKNPQHRPALFSQSDFLFDLEAAVLYKAVTACT